VREIDSSIDDRDDNATRVRLRGPGRGSRNLHHVPLLVPARIGGSLVGRDYIVRLDIEDCGIRAVAPHSFGYRKTRWVWDQVQVGISFEIGASAGAREEVSLFSITEADQNARGVMGGSVRVCNGAGLTY